MTELTYPYNAGIGDDTATLTDLWQHRSNLSSVEIGYVYSFVRRALRGYYPPELRALAEDKEELVAQFIFSRVLRLNADRTKPHGSFNGAPFSAFAVCAYFQRYLIDCLRTASHRRNVSIETDGVSAHVDAHAHPLNDPVESILAEYGLDERRTRQAARSFVSSLDESERIILAASLGGSCRIKGGLKGIADQYRLSSYHYHARKLGVTLRKSANPDDFAMTKIGSWMMNTLGIEIIHENRPVILIVLNLLALDARV
ncbi:hypothetical protein [Paraburkholderia atlantica]|uniref:Uncharacterized protein n=1 Tax=Paraburkholderia atlantica TaxID=2654982 RepID=D5WNI0_PARAM|nr:hypothetical protein [Paraburkholderia atlantica]ADG20859.1 conserved hypothetical protein [Paraburkholderia atlantica]MBB5510927.1 hypothetical protein [Paraburkholderia atlantica]